MFAVYKKELRSYFCSMIAPALIGFILLFSGIFVSLNSLFSYAASIETSYTSTLFVLLIAVPVLSMRSLAHERSGGTQLLLDSLPLKPISVILGKYFAMLTVIAIPIAVTFLYTFVLSLYGNVNFLTSAAASFAFFLCAAAMLAIGLFISSLTESVIVCAVVTFAVMLAIYFLPSIVLMLPATVMGSFTVITVLVIAAGIVTGYITSSRLVCYGTWALFESVLIGVLCFSSETLEGGAAQLISTLSLTERFETFATYGVFDLSAIVYFITVSALFVFFTLLSMKKRRWS